MARLLMIPTTPTTPTTLPARALRRGWPVLLAALLAGCHGSTERQETLAVPQGVVSTQGPLQPSGGGGPRAHLEGAFGPTFAWPVMPIHMVLLPDGRVLAYGTDEKGRQGAMFKYTVWEPGAGGGAEAFLTLPNRTGTDIFCSSQSLLPDGTVALLGGDDYGGKPLNNGNPDMNVFDPRDGSLRKVEGMAYKRWYPTLVMLPSGDRVVLGGRIRDASSRWTPWERAVASTPEVYTPGSGWRALTGAASNAAYGSHDESYYYPRAWLAPAGDVVILAHDGRIFRLDPRGAGRLRELGVTAPPARERMPAAMFAPGRILVLRDHRRAVVLDLNGAQPVVEPTAAPGVERQWGNATVLADGQVWVNGGSITPNMLGDEHYDAELWNPATGRWSPAGRAAQARLYHSASMLLADGSVVTGGGGAPGPLIQLNGEVYYPPYLFMRDGSGRFAPRPAVASAPAQLAAGAELRLALAPGVKATRLTLVRSGSVTHSFNHEQRFMALDFAQQGSELRAALPSDVNQLPPGYWLVFVFDEQGVPSLGHTMLVTNPATAG